MDAGDLSVDELERALVTATERVRGVRVHLDTLMQSAHYEDVALRARLYNDLLTVLNDVGRTLQQRRLEAVQELRAGGSSYEDIGRILGLSRSRVQQLVAAAAKRR